MNSVSKPVEQHSLCGKKIRTHKSMTAAERATGIHASAIGATAAEPIAAYYVESFTGDSAVKEYLLQFTFTNYSDTLSVNCLFIKKINHVYNYPICSHWLTFFTKFFCMKNKPDSINSISTK